MTEGLSTGAAPTIDPVQAGRDALTRRRWAQAYDLLTGADQATALSGGDLELLATAAFFAATPPKEWRPRSERSRPILGRATRSGPHMWRSTWPQAMPSVASTRLPPAGPDVPRSSSAKETPTPTAT